MEKEIGKISAEGITFFGKTNRLISHELKNILAIISETLGLLDELLELSESGMELKTERLRSMSDSIIEEVDRANDVIRCMNTFAHSVDTFIREIDLKEAVTLAMRLAGLNPICKAVKIELVEAGSHTIYTSPFFLENLLYHIFYLALSAASPEKHIKVSLLADSGGAGVEISGLASNAPDSFQTPQVASLATAVGASLTVDLPGGKLHIAIPQKLTGSPVEVLQANL